MGHVFYNNQFDQGYLRVEVHFIDLLFWFVSGPVRVLFNNENNINSLDRKLFPTTHVSAYSFKVLGLLRSRGCYVKESEEIYKFSTDKKHDTNQTVLQTLALW